MVVVGFILSIFIGIALGLIGGGGSILTVPVLVYLFHVDPVTATGYSLFVVGVTSAMGSLRYFNSKLVHFKAAIVFGIPSMLAVYLTRSLIVPTIPHLMISWGSFQLTKPLFMMILFGSLMITAAIAMIKGSSTETKQDIIAFNYPMILLQGLVEGSLTGFVGAGGGFLIIPALVIFSRLPMKQAIGTSLVIISAKSLLGFTVEMGRENLDWSLLLLVTGAAIVGIFVGTFLSKRIDGAKLKPAFGWFVLCMGVYIISRELWIN